MLDHVQRATKAYFRSFGTDEAIPQPASDPVMRAINDKQYVVLHNVNGVLAVYRVRKDNRLYRLRRWPAALNEL